MRRSLNPVVLEGEGGHAEYRRVPAGWIGKWGIFPPLLCLTVCVSGCGAEEMEPGPGEGEPTHNTLSPEERGTGWRLLFDGHSTAGWRGYNQDSFPKTGWGVAEGNLIVMAPSEDGGSGGDIVSDSVFSDFELTFEFRLSSQGNSGVFYRVVERPGEAMWQVAPEYQVLDDSAYIEMGTMDMHTHLTGDNYDLHAAQVRASRPVGEWNRARILVDGTHVEHWLNGQKTVEYEFFSPEWEALVAESKFAPYPAYGRASAGRIGIQDHGHEIRYRNIKVRPF